MASGVSITNQRLNHSYRYYGLGISIDKTLWGAQDSSASPDVFVRSRKESSFEASQSAGGWFRYEQLSNGSHRLHWDQIAQLWISADGNTIDYSLQGEKWHSTFCHHLLPQALSFSLLERGIDPLHGCVVKIDGSAVAFIGGSGRGKSTLAAHFWKRGHTIYSDDLVAPRFRKAAPPTVCGGPPHLKLSRATLEGLGITGTINRLLAGTDKYVLAIKDQVGGKPELPLRAIYVLTGKRGNVTELQTRNAREAFIDLTRNPFNAIQNDRRRWQTQFETANQLIQSVPVRRLSFPKTFAALDRVYDRIMDDVTPLLR